MFADALGDQAVRPGAGGVPRSQGTRPVVRVWFGLAWLVVAVASWCALSVVARWSIGAPVTQLLQGLVPVVFLPVWIIAVTAFAGRRWPLAVLSSVLVVTHVLLVWPALRGGGAPAWAVAAPRITLLSVNLFDRNRTPDAAAAAVLARRADVLVLVETSPRMRDALVRAGIDRQYPHQLIATPSPNGNTDGIYARRPFTGGRQLAVFANSLPVVKVPVGRRQLEIIGVHIDGPRYGVDQWSKEITDLVWFARTSDPLVISGDFNATRWHSPFRDLLDADLTDAHESVGKGLSRSWPVLGTPLAAFGPLMRIDHALTNRDVAALDVRDIRVPGSDHAGFEVELAVRQ